MIEIDGSQGEGGGQILRSALSLSCLTGKAFRITKIRAQRSKPGLRPQHLKAVLAAREISKAHTSGERLGSGEIIFQPQKISAGKFNIDVGTAGSTSLILQTLFLPLARAGEKSTLTITGGTHVPWSPSYHYLEWQWLPYLRKMGVDSHMNIERAGFFPKGTGRVWIEIFPTRSILPLRLIHRGTLRRLRGLSTVSNLPVHIAQRQQAQVEYRLGEKYDFEIQIKHLPSLFKGTTLLLMAEFEGGSCCYIGLGKLGKPAEKVADEVVDEFEYFMSTNGTVDQYLSDQLLLPLSFAIGESELLTPKVTQHLLTNATIISKFIPVNIEINGGVGQPGVIRITNTMGWI